MRSLDDIFSEYPVVGEETKQKSLDDIFSGYPVQVKENHFDHTGFLPDDYEDMQAQGKGIGKFADRLNQEGFKQFGKNIVNDAIDSTYKWGNDVLQHSSELSVADNAMQLNGDVTPTAFGDVLVPEKEKATAYMQSMGNLANDFKTPVYAGAMAGAPGLGVAAIPFMATDISHSYAEGGVPQVARDMTYGPIADFTENTTADSLFENPVSTAIEGAMAIAPVVIAGKGLGKFGENRSIKEIFDDGLANTEQKGKTIADSDGGALWQAIADKESNFNFDAYNQDSGARGFYNGCLKHGDKKHRKFLVTPMHP